MRLLLTSAAVCVVVVVGCNRDVRRIVPAELIADEPAEPRMMQTAAPLAAIMPMKLALNEPEPSACPANMILVEGSYCPDVRQDCKRYMDPPGRYEYFRCAEYVSPARCVSKQRKKMRFCIDRDEYAASDKALPDNYQSYTHASEICQQGGKRMCLESEWNFACEGEEMRPYPYGFKRDAQACNADRTDILTDYGTLKDLRAPGNAYPRCVSPFGVRNLAGNLEEFVSIDGTSPVLPAMKGAYWQPSRNHCRAAQTAHDRFYNGTETGFRCCADVP